MGCLPYFYTWCGLSANLQTKISWLLFMAHGVYSAGRPSRWASAHILVDYELELILFFCFLLLILRFASNLGCLFPFGFFPACYGREPLEISAKSCTGFQALSQSVCVIEVV